MDYTPKAIGRDEFIALYTPGQVISSEGFRTSLAQDRHKGRLVMVHELATSPGEKRRALNLLAQLREVHSALVIGVFLIDEEPVIVTKFILGFVSFRQWLEHAVAESATVVMDTRDEVPDLDLSRHAGAPTHLALKTTEMQQVPLNLETVPSLEDTAIGLEVTPPAPPMDRVPPAPPADTQVGAASGDGFTEFFAEVPPALPPQSPPTTPAAPPASPAATVPPAANARPTPDNADTFSEIFGQLAPVDPPVRMPAAPPAARTSPPVVAAPPAVPISPPAIPPAKQAPPPPTPPVFRAPERQYQPIKAPVAPVQPKQQPSATGPSMTELFGAGPTPAPTDPGFAAVPGPPPVTPPRHPPVVAAPPAPYDGQSGTFTQMFGSGESEPRMPRAAPTPGSAPVPFPPTPRLPQPGSPLGAAPAPFAPIAPPPGVPRSDLGGLAPPPVPNPSADWLRGVPPAPKVPFSDPSPVRQAERAVESALPQAPRMPAPQVPGLGAPRAVESSFTEMLKPARPPIQPPAPPALPPPSVAPGGAAAKPASMLPLIVVLIVCVALVVAVVLYAALR